MLLPDRSTSLTTLAGAGNPPETTSGNGDNKWQPVVMVVLECPP
jgi:hypothetical protein